MSEAIWCPPKECDHDLPKAWLNEMCIFRCGKCNLVFESRYADHTIIGGWVWKPRSERWLKRKLKNHKHEYITGDK